MTRMAGGIGGRVSGMPGMASDQDFKNLRAATGPELVVLSLQLMLRHHRGGSAMLSDAAQNAARPEVRNLAAQMLGSQQAEADHLTQLLTAPRGHPAGPVGVR